MRSNPHGEEPAQRASRTTRPREARLAIRPGCALIRHYFFLPEPNVGCHPAVFWLGAAAMVLIFSFLGFLASRLPFCSPLAMSVSLDWTMTPYLDAESH